MKCDRNGKKIYDLTQPNVKSNRPMNELLSSNAFVKQTLHPFSDFENFQRTNRTAILRQFSNLFYALERAFLPRKKRCKPHLNQPTNIDTISS